MAKKKLGINQEIDAAREILDKENQEPSTKSLEIKVLEVRKGLEKRFGKGVVINGNELPSVSFISTGSLYLDFILGGGFPKGRFVLVTGEKHSGKSFIAYKTMAEYQKMDNRPAIIIDYEKAVTREWCESLGIDMSNVIVSQPTSVNEGMEVMRAYMSEHLTGFVLIDSIAAGATKEEMERTSFDDERAVGAKAWNKFFRVAQCVLNIRNKETGINSDCCVLLINQERTGFTSWGSYKTQPGGMGKDYAGSSIIMLRKNTDLIQSKGIYIEGKNDDKKPGVESNKIVGIETKFKVDKSKVSAAYGKEGMFRVIFDGEDAGKYDIYFELYTFSKLFGLITETMNGFIDIKCDESFVDNKIRGKENFFSLLKSDTELAYKLLTEIKNRINNEYQEEENTNEENIEGANVIEEETKNKGMLLQE